MFARTVVNSDQTSDPSHGLLKDVAVLEYFNQEEDDVVGA
jgi:hypothetical protein